MFNAQTEGEKQRSADGNLSPDTHNMPNIGYIKVLICIKVLTQRKNISKEAPIPLTTDCGTIEAPIPYTSYNLQQIVIPKRRLYYL